MAATVGSRIFPFSRALLLTRNCRAPTLRHLSAVRSVQNGRSKYIWLIGGSIVAFTCARLFKSKEVQASNIGKLKVNINAPAAEIVLEPQIQLMVKKSNDFQSVRLNSKERRFIKFASSEFDGQLYMTPRDFLDSIVEQEPRPRLKRRTLTPDEISKFRDGTPVLKKGSSRLFRNIRDKGIITYTEYLFLLSILTKPTSGFRIAFNMFDTDGNQRVDINEFLVIRKILGGSFSEQKMDEQTLKIRLYLVSTEEQAKNLKVTTPKNAENKPDPCVPRVERKYPVVTTLQTHFFGPKGDKVLQFEGFRKFTDNLQTEILELEFNEFSKGNPVITELDFAKLLLRYTYLDTDEYDAFLERLLTRVKDESGIGFQEFLDFCRFLNNLDDFSIAMRMYNLADFAISKDEFCRAVKICTGYTLSEHLVDTVFAIFDKDGDGRLSHEEFVAIMRDRLHRGFKSNPRREGWGAFKSCLRRELRKTDN